MQNKNGSIEQKPFFNTKGFTKINGRKQFGPYESNSGTTLAISTPEFNIFASDIRNSSSFTIHSRNCSKIFKLKNSITFSATGFFGDIYRVFEILKHKQELFYQQFEKEMLVSELAHFLMNVLYSKRFFPFYGFIVLGGIENGECAMYSYDPVGSYQKDTARCYGTGMKIVQPILDSKIYRKNNLKKEEEFKEEEIIAIVKKAFESVSERDVKTGDGVEIVIIRKDGSTDSNIIKLRRD
uniref:Proteasome subunit beta type-1-A n=1 Tax=Lepeophtheirus salmonis TaxID=72036 RepID=C1BSB3_LEPSM|nr:Proteasome subunit beta type-1-A [Lepeophtheirus salmonis]